MGLWLVETRPAAAQELRNAMLAEDFVAVRAALEAAEAVGLPAGDLDAARRALEVLKVPRNTPETPGLQSTRLDLRIMTPPATDDVTSSASKVACKTKVSLVGTRLLDQGVMN